MQIPLLITVLAVCAPGIKEAPPPNPIVGEWMIEMATYSGQLSAKSGAFSWVFTADGKRFTRQKGKDVGDKKFGYRLDPKAKPQTIDLTDDPSVPEKAIPGIYKIDGDELTICISGEKLARPTDFESAIGSPNKLYKFKRVKPMKPD